MSLFALSLVLCTLAAAQEFQHYCWGFLNPHEERTPIPEAQALEIQKGHMAHMERMAAAGRLLAAGPLATPGGPRGLLVYQCESAAQAEEWTKPDPAVINKRLRVEMYRWMNNGIWGEPLATKLKNDPAYKYEMVQLPFAIVMRTGKTANGALPPQEVEKAHLAYSLKLVGDGKLRSFGPFEGSKDKLGVFVYGAMPIEEARKLAEEDPLVQGGWGQPVMHMWFVADEAVPLSGTSRRAPVNNVAEPDVGAE
jgi:uncharacterized protein YciI